MIKLIVCDLDGTLLPAGEKKLDEKVFKTLDLLKDKNVAFCVASGRSYHELKRLFADSPVDIYFIASDGALAVYKEETLFHNKIPASAQSMLISSARSQGLPGVMFSSKYLSYYVCSCPKFSDYVHKNLNYHVLRVSRAQEMEEPVYKVSFYRKHKLTLSADLNRQLTEVYDGGKWQDFVPNGTDKAEAISQLQKLLGISAAETAVFGDNTNDVKMLLSTPNSYAVAGANPKAIKAGRHQTENILKTIEEIILNK